MLELSNGKCGQYYSLVGVADSAPLKMKRRLLELGFTRGQKVRVVRKSLLKRAYLVEVRGFTLSVRRDIAQYLLVR